MSLLIGDDFKLEPYEHGWHLYQNREVHCREAKRGGKFLYNEDGSPKTKKHFTSAGYFCTLEGAVHKVVELLARGVAGRGDVDLDGLRGDVAGWISELVGALECKRS